MPGIKSGLLWYLIRQTRPITLAAMPIACLFVIFCPSILEWRNGLAAVFVLIHSRLIVLRFGRFDHGNFAFLYTRGFSRDSIWAYKLLASFLAILAVWVPAALIIWTHLRSLAQDFIFHSAYFPIMAPRETMVPFAWLAGYCILIPLLHYQWIRKAQPVRGGMGGDLVVAGVIVTMAVLIIEGFRHQWFNWLTAVAAVVMSIVTMAASWKLHRRLEVRA